MNLSRRQFLKNTALSGGALTALAPRVFAQEVKAPPSAFHTGTPRMRLGIVTFNIASDWDIPTIIKNCTEAKFEGVELRAGHKHGVETTLTKAERAEVKKRFGDSPVSLWSLGSAFDYHTPDQAKLREDIAATKDYIVLAHQVGATGVKVRPNGLPAEVPVEKTLEQIGRSLREVGEFARDYGQQIRLEVHGPGTSLLPNIKRIVETADQVQVGVCWNSNLTDLHGDGFDRNFDLVKNKIFTVHLHDLFDETYPYRRLFARLNEAGFNGFCLAEIQPTSDPVRVMKYYRAQWLAYQNLL